MRPDLVPGGAGAPGGDIRQQAQDAIARAAAKGVDITEQVRQRGIQMYGFDPLAGGAAPSGFESLTP